MLKDIGLVMLGLVVGAMFMLSMNMVKLDSLQEENTSLVEDNKIMVELATEMSSKSMKQRKEILVQDSYIIKLENNSTLNQHRE